MRIGGTKAAKPRPTTALGPEVLAAIDANGGELRPFELTIREIGRAHV